MDCWDVVWLVDSKDHEMQADETVVLRYSQCPVLDIRRLFFVARHPTNALTLRAPISGWEIE